MSTYHFILIHFVFDIVEVYYILCSNMCNTVILVMSMDSVIIMHGYKLAASFSSETRTAHAPQFVRASMKISFEST